MSEFRLKMLFSCKLERDCAPEKSPNETLLALFEELNRQHFGGILPRIELRFSGRLKSTGGQYFRKPRRIIQVSTRYFEMERPWDEIRDTLGHEMVHYWLDFLGRPCGHNPEFRAKLRACGFNRYSRLKPMGAKYVYRCPGCGLAYHRRRRGVWSCGPCSGPRFNPQYKLILVTEGVNPSHEMRILP